MRGYLLDTNAISLLAPKRGPNALSPIGGFRDWLREHDGQLFLSTITLAEIQAGISRLKREGAPRRAAALAHWLSAILDHYESRTLSFTSAAALEAGRLLDRAIGAGADPGFEDAAVAATAVVYDLVVVTENVRHFEYFQVSLLRPSDNFH